MSSRSPDEPLPKQNAEMNRFDPFFERDDTDRRFIDTASGSPSLSTVG